REEAPEQVECLRPDRPLPGLIGLVPARPALGGPLPYLGERARVDREQLLHRSGVLGAELVIPVETVPPACRLRERLVVRDVARGLLQVGGEAAALQHLGEDVGDPLAGDMRAAELRDRVVAEAAEDPLVEAGRALSLFALERTAARGHVRRELVEVEAPQRSGVARVAGEQRSLDRLRQVDEGEDGAGEGRAMGREEPAFLFCEFLDRVAHGLAILDRADDARGRAFGLARHQISWAISAPTTSPPAAFASSGRAPG